MTKLTRGLIAATTVLLIGGAHTARAASINIDVFTGHTIVEGGAPFSDPAGSLVATDVQFGTDTLWNWHPFGLDNFGAFIAGILNVSATDVYNFTLKSEEGSVLYIDGLPIVDNGGQRPLQQASNWPNLIPLTQGSHTFSIEFFGDSDGPSGVDLYLPCSGNSCVEYGDAAVPKPPVPDATVPEPTSIFLLGSGAFALLAARRRKLAQARA